MNENIGHICTTHNARIRQSGITDYRNAVDYEQLSDYLSDTSSYNGIFDITKLCTE